MDPLQTEYDPKICAKLGLDCGTCTREAARHLARVCGGLAPQNLHRIFVQLYPSPGCQPMARNFVVAYAESAPIPAQSQPVLVASVAAA